VSWSVPAVVLVPTEVVSGSDGSYGASVTGSPVDYDNVVDLYAVQVVLSDIVGAAGNSVVAVELQGSLDGANWYALGGGEVTATDGVSLLSVSGAAQYVQAQVQALNYPSVTYTATVGVTVTTRVS
jgi:hypothetical protein